MNARLKSVGALGLLTAALPANAVLTAVALLTRRGPRRAQPDAPKTVLLSGGKMSKTLALARGFHRAGHRVVLCETAKYRLTGHRFSRAVDAFHVVPSPEDRGYAEALLEVVRREGVDVYVPVCAPAASVPDARARALVDGHCEVIHVDGETIATLDDKATFCATAAELGLPVPDAHRITDPRQVLDFAFPPGAEYILKSIPYDPVRRMDLTRLPRPTPEETAAFVAALPISEAHPWVLQEFLAGSEFCTHSTVRDGEVRLHCTCASSAYQLNYEHLEIPEVEAWARRFVGALRLTGQVSLDLIRGADGEYRAIECNPRTHSAITMFYDHPDLAAAYLEDGPGTVRPTAASRPTYWLYHELWQALKDPSSAPGRLRTVAAGKEAVFAWDDPLPFLLLHHLQLPALLLAALRDGRDWVKIDVNIGKLVEPGGD